MNAGVSSKRETKMWVGARPASVLAAELRRLRNVTPTWSLR